jgi:hypothetical protein
MRRALPPTRRPGYRGAVFRRSLVAAVVAAASLLVLAGPVAAHGDHDARPVARNLVAGPYTISLWPVYPDAGSAMTPHLIVMFDGLAAVPPEARVAVSVNGWPTEVRPSTTTANGLETAEGLDEGDVVTVTISAGDGVDSTDPVVVPPPPTSMLPMEELIYGSIFLTIGTAWWIAGRTARAWRRPLPQVG